MSDDCPACHTHTKQPPHRCPDDGRECECCVICARECASSREEGERK